MQGKTIQHTAIAKQFQDIATQENTIEGKARQCKTIQNKNNTRQHNTILQHDQTRQDNTLQAKTRQYKTTQKQKP